MNPTAASLPHTKAIRE